MHTVVQAVLNNNVRASIPTIGYIAKLELWSVELERGSDDLSLNPEM